MNYVLHVFHHSPIKYEFDLMNEMKHFYFQRIRVQLCLVFPTKRGTIESLSYHVFCLIEQSSTYKQETTHQACLPLKQGTIARLVKRQTRTRLNKTHCRVASREVKYYYVFNVYFTLNMRV